MEYKECHYKILGVPETASQDEIRKAFQRLAKKYHPDKNQTENEDNNDKFIKIRAAFEILSDPKERSYYDKNKESLLFSKNVKAMIDPMKYRDSSVFSGFNDDKKGFFTVYRNLFNAINSEEVSFTKDVKDFPDFGYSHSPYKDIVAPFYNFWLNFCTRKSFSWCDKYDVKLAQNRAELRATEKENKSYREEAKKNYNKSIKSLVQFIHKIDPRRIKHEQEKKDQATPTCEKNKVEEVLQPDYDWQHHYENYHEGMDELEDLIEQEFCEKIQSLDISKLPEKEFQYGVAVVDEDDIICMLCDSNFTSYKSFKKHIKSRLHVEIFDCFIRNLNEDKELTKEEQSNDNILKAKTSDRKIPEKADKPVEQIFDPNVDALECQICHTTFPSRNKLFQHIKETGHAALKSSIKPKNNTRKKRKK